MSKALGAGRFGTCWLCEDSHDEVEKVLKQVSPVRGVYVHMSSIPARMPYVWVVTAASPLVRMCALVHCICCIRGQGRAALFFLFFF